MQFRALDSTIAISCQHLCNKFAALFQSMPFVNSERPHLHSFITIGNFIPCSDPLCFALNPSLYHTCMFSFKAGDAMQHNGKS